MSNLLEKVLAAPSSFLGAVEWDWTNFIQENR